jgi:hypothetical protein
MRFDMLDRSSNGACSEEVCNGGLGTVVCVLESDVEEAIGSDTMKELIKNARDLWKKSV